MGAFLALTTSTFAQSVQDALYLQEKQQFGKAEAVFRTMLGNNPSSAINYYYLGDAFFHAYLNYKGGDNEFYENSNFDSAKKYFTKGSETEPNNGLLMVVNGKLLLAKGNAAGAKPLFDKALLASKSKDINILLETAEANILFPKTGDLALANDLLTKATAIDKKNTRAIILLGDLGLAKGDGGAAVTNYENVEDMDKKAPLPYLKVGDLYKVSNYKESLKAFQTALTIDSGYSPAHKELSDLYLRNRDYAKAADEYKKFINELNTDLTDAERERYASFLFIGGNFKDASAQLNLLKNTDPNDFTLLRLKGYGYFEVHNYAQSVKSMQGFFSKAPKEKVIGSDYLYYGRALTKTGQDSLGIINLLKYFNADSSDLGMYDTIGNLYFKDKKYLEAANMYAREVSRQGQAASYQLIFNEGYAYYSVGKYDFADSAFKKLTIIGPQYTYGWIWRAKANNGLDPKGEKGMSKPYYEKFIEIAAKDPSKNKDDLTEAYLYLGTYYYNAADKENSKLNMQKVLDIDPNNETAKQVMKYLIQAKGK